MKHMLQHASYESPSTGAVRRSAARFLAPLAESVGLASARCRCWYPRPRRIAGSHRTENTVDASALAKQPEQNATKEERDGGLAFLAAGGFWGKQPCHFG